MLLEIFVGFFAFFIVFCLLKKWTHSLPGPVCLPFVGFYPFLGSNPIVKIMNLADQYGEIMRVNILDETYIILNSFDMIKKLFGTEGENVSSRSTDQFNAYSFAFGRENIFSTDGEKWNLLSKFFVSKLSELGMGKSQFEFQVQEMCKLMILKISETNGNPHDFYRILDNYATNVLNLLLFNKHYDPDDPFYIKLQNTSHRFFLEIGGLDGFYYGFGWYLLSKIKGKIRNLKEIKQSYFELINEILEERKKEGAKHECKDLLDYYLKEMEGANAKHFDLETLVANFSLLFADPPAVGGCLLYHAFNLMALHPNIQENVYREIITIIGKEKEIEAEDQKKLHYTRAVIAEIERFSCVGPLWSVRTNKRELTVGKYRIPKGSKLMANMWKVTRDKKYYANPDHFDPNHFLNENGCFVKTEAHVPFSLGKRRCIGIKLGEVQNFIGFSSLIQRFKWKAAESENVKRDVQEGLMKMLLPYKLCAMPR